MELQFYWLVTSDRPYSAMETHADKIKAYLKYLSIKSLRVNMHFYSNMTWGKRSYLTYSLIFGDGKLLDEEGGINIPGNLSDVVGDLISLTNKLYPNIHKVGKDHSSWLKEWAILLPTNDSINNFLLEKLPTKYMRYEVWTLWWRSRILYITLWSSCTLKTPEVE